MMIWYSLVQLGIIFVFLQCTQGVVRHFNTKRHSDINTECFFEKHRSGSDNDIKLRSKFNFDFKPQPRLRRQDEGGDPEATRSSIPNDHRDYGRISYSGEGSQVLYVLTYDLSRSNDVTSSALYRSDDYGLTFEDQVGKLRTGFVLNPTIYRFPSDNRIVIFADDVKKRIYVTTDEGESFTTYDIPVDPKTLKLHPTLSGWVLGHDPDQGALMYSENSGATWDTVALNVHSVGSSQYYKTNDFVWGEPGIDWNIDNLTPSDMTTKVFYNVLDTNTTGNINDRTFYVASNSGGRYTSREFDCNLGLFNSFILDGSYIFAGQYNSSSRSTRLYVSYMRNPFKLTRIPTTLPQYRYIVGSYRSSQALILVQHGSHYTLYLSDETGTYYTLSLEDVGITNSGIDLEIIHSINGTMIANQYTSISSLNLQTMITFDNGARWNRIASPVNGSDGLPTNCVLPRCSLHFHLDSSTDYRRIGVYSRSSAPGLIVAHGNRGDYLSQTVNDISVYISRDGGLSWNQSLDSSWDIEIIDHGGLLVAARDDRQANSMTIKYSCNEGMSWNDFDFINNSVVVWSVVTEPGQTTTQVLLFSAADTSPYWIVTHVNFTAIFPRTCGPSDYYQWTVSDGRIWEQQCLLGETRIIERRKPSVCCWNSRQYERVISTEPCECTAADFECEWGYNRTVENECVLDPIYGPKLDCLTGYRKIAGDACVDGVSEQFLSPSDCVLDSDDSSNSDCDTSVTPDNPKNDSIKNDSSSTVTPTPDMPDNPKNGSNKNDSSTGNTGQTSGRHNNGATVAGSVIGAVVLLIILGVIIVVILGIAYVIRKRKKTFADQPDGSLTDDIVRMPKEKEVVGGHMSFKKLKEDV